MPLRASHFHHAQLRPIVLLGNQDYLEREWPSLANFPDIYVVPGSPLKRADLYSARLRHCAICVVIGSRGIYAASDDHFMLDKEVILCSLNIRAMKFPDSGVPAASSRWQQPMHRSGADIPLITELMIDANIHYLDPDDNDDNASEMAIYLTPPFARGIAFTGSVLDALVSTAYFDRNAMTVIRHLVTGGVTPALEQFLAEGGALDGELELAGAELRTRQTPMESPERPSTTATAMATASRKTTRDSEPILTEVSGDPILTQARQRPRVDQLALTDVRLGGPEARDRPGTFGELFCKAVCERGILCLGVYRLNPTGLLEHAHLEAVWQNELQTNASAAGAMATGNVRASESSERLTGTPQTRRLSTFATPIEVRIFERSRLRRQQTADAAGSFNLPDGSSLSEVCRAASIVPTDSIEASPLPVSRERLKRLELAGTEFPLSVVNRYVITNPPVDFALFPSDLVFCLCPFIQVHKDFFTPPIDS